MKNKMIEKYYNKRLDLLLRPLILQIGENFPLVKKIVQIICMENSNRLNKAAPKEQRLIHHLFKILLDDGTELVSGARQLLGQNFPKSFVRHLEQARRIISNDVATIEPLDEISLSAAMRNVQGKVDQIISAQFYPGLLFLQEFGEIIEHLLGAGCSLPAWLYANINGFHEMACAHSVDIGQQNIEKYKDIYCPLDEINKSTFGRSTAIVRILGKIKANKTLLINDIHDANDILKTYLPDKTALDKTEKVLPLLWALQSETITLWASAKVMVESYWKQVQKGRCLTAKQLDYLKSVFKAKEAAWNKLPIEARTMSANLVKQFEAFENKVFLTPEEKSKMDKIRDTLMKRGVNLDLLPRNQAASVKKGDLL